MNQKLRDWASVAEIASGIAVVVTLVVLIFGIRENTDVMRASMYSESINSLNQWRDSIFQSREAAGIWEAFRTGEVDQLDALDMTRLVQTVSTIFGIYEHSYFSWERALIGDSEWERFETQICFQYERLIRVPRLVSGFELSFTEQFRTYVSDLCSR